jgi:hypothetical protein
VPLKLKVLQNRFNISRADEEPTGTDRWAAIRDHDGWTLIEPNSSGVWRAIQIDQEFGLEEVGILLQLLQPLATAQIPIMAYSTYKTDYVFIDSKHLLNAAEALKEAGHEVIEE